MHFSNSHYRDLFAPIAGVLYTLAFAPFDFAYLAPPALLVLFACWQNTTPLRAFMRAYLFGLGSFGLGVSWVYISIHDFGNAGMLAAGTLTMLFVAFWALFPALAAYLAVVLRVQKNIVLTALIWVLIEYLRGFLVLNGFPWLLGAYSQLTTPLAGYIPIFGAYGTGFLLALSASVGLSILQDNKRRLMLSTLLTALWLTGALLKSIDWTFPVGQPLRVSLIQGNISQDQKWKPENRLNTLLLYKKLTEEHWDSQIIVWPETAIPAYLSEVKDFFLTPLSRDAQMHNSDLIVSLPVEGESENEMYNAVITLGKESAIYRKDHLLPFGEYMPWQPLSGYILKKLSLRLGNFTAGGSHQPLLKAASYPFITSICYEDAFGDAAIAGLPEAAYLVNVTNDGWFGNSVEPHQHLQIARMRALETGRYLLRATNTGATAVISPNGRIIGQAPLFTTAVLTDTITPMGGMTPYAYLGDKAIIIALTILLLGLLVYEKVMRGR